LLPWHSEKDHLVLNGSKIWGTLGLSEHVAERKTDPANNNLLVDNTL